jgi:hypothetical protein
VRVLGFGKRTSWFQGILDGGNDSLKGTVAGMWWRIAHLWIVIMIINVQQWWLKHDVLFRELATSLHSTLQMDIIYTLVH